jgi:hypothetical protein
MSFSSEFTELADLTMNDIFRKFDMLLNRELTFVEFKNFYEQVGLTLTETDFRAKFLQKYQSSEKGITLAGFKDFMRDTVKTKGNEAMWTWLQDLGYDRALWPVRSRSFVLAFHCEQEISVVVRDAV